MPATQKGIYHNLKESKYTVSNNEIVFFFSSKLYMNKFLDRYKDNRDNFIRRQKKLTDEAPFDYRMLADVHFYKDVEKRGFYVWLKGVSITWEDLCQYALRKMIEKNTQDWYETQKPKLGERLKIME